MATQETTNTTTTTTSSTTPAAPAPAPAPTAAEITRQVSNDDNLACQWDKCSERCESAEALYVRLLAFDLPQVPGRSLRAKLTPSVGAHL